MSASLQTELTQVACCAQCAWTYGKTYRSGGGVANMFLRCPGSASGCTSRHYLIQRMWVNSGTGYCALSA